MIGLILDDDPATAKRYCEKNGINWTQAFAGPFGIAKVLEDQGSVHTRKNEFGFGAAAAAYG